MAPTIKTMTKFFTENKNASKSAEDLQAFRNLNADFFTSRGKNVPDKFKIPTKSGSREYKSESNKVLSYLVAEYQRKPKMFVKEAVAKAIGENRLNSDTEVSRNLKKVFEEAFGSSSSEAETTATFQDTPPSQIEGESETTEEAVEEAEEKIEETVENLVEQTSGRNQGGRKRKAKASGVVDEPRPITQVFNAATEVSKIDFTKDTIEDRVDQIEAVFDIVDNLVTSEQIPIDKIPENIRTSTKQGLEVIRSGIKEKKSKKSIFSKIKSFGKTVLGFIAVAPLPIPPQLKVGAAGLLTGIEAIEQTVSTVQTLTGGNTDIETDKIKAGLDLAANVEQLAPAAEFASGVVSAVEGAVELKKAIFGEQKGKDGSMSTPINADLLADTETTLQVEKSKIDDDLKASEGIIKPNEIKDSTASTVKVPIEAAEGVNITPDKAKELATETPEEEIAEEEKRSEEQEGTDQSQEEPAAVLSGNRQIQGLYENPLHPDALGIYFDSSSFPKWDTSLLKDRERRFSSLTPESTKPYLLQQNRMLFEKYGVDLLIPELLFDESSDPVDIERENFEIIQLWAKLKGIHKGGSSQPESGGDDDTVGMKLGDLFQFRGLLKGTPGPQSSEGHPPENIVLGGSQDSPPALGPVTPLPPVEKPLDEQQAPEGSTGTEEADSPTMQAFQHPKDTTKNFVYSPSGIRISEQISDEEARKAAKPSLSEMVTLEGHPQLQTRRNLTRGNRHGGPSVRGPQMNAVRRSMIGTQTNLEGRNVRGYVETGKTLDQRTGKHNVNVRI